MSRTWSLYDAATGSFTGRTIIGTPAALASNLRAGMLAIEGKYDAQRQRIDTATGAVVPREPDAPTEAALARAARADRNRRLAAADVAVLRALERGEAVPPSLAAYREALRDLPDQPGFPQSINWPEMPP